MGYWQDEELRRPIEEVKESRGTYERAEEGQGVDRGEVGGADGERERGGGRCDTGGRKDEGG